MRSRLTDRGKGMGLLTRLRDPLVLGFDGGVYPLGDQELPLTGRPAGLVEGHHADIAKPAPGVDRRPQREAGHQDE